MVTWITFIDILVKKPYKTEKYTKYCSSVNHNKIYKAYRPNAHMLDILMQL